MLDDILTVEESEFLFNMSIPRDTHQEFSRWSYTYSIAKELIRKQRSMQKAKNENEQA